MGQGGLVGTVGGTRAMQPYYMVDSLSRPNPGDTGTSKPKMRWRTVGPPLGRGFSWTSKERRSSSPWPGLHSGSSTPPRGSFDSSTWDVTLIRMCSCWTFLWRFLLLGARWRRRLLPLPPVDGGGEEGRRMFLFKKKLSTPSLNSKLRYTSLLEARHSSYQRSSWLIN